MMKICKKCGQEKPLSEYHKKLDGHQPKCKSCVIEYQRERRLSDPVRMKEIQDRSYQRNGKKYNGRYKDKDNARRRSRYQSDEEYRDERKASAAKWLSANKDRSLATHSVWVRHNRPLVNAAIHRYHDKHRDGLRLLWVTQSNRRRARVRSSEGSFTTSEWVSLLEKYGYICLCCGKGEPEVRITADHVVPVSRGGSNGIENIQPLCGPCNSRKGATFIDYR